MTQVRKDVLNGWKEIAAYLGRDPRTVERWEKQRSLPVRRLPGSGRASVYALVPELDAWLTGTATQEDNDSELAEPTRTRRPGASAPDIQPSAQISQPVAVLRPVDVPEPVEAGDRVEVQAQEEPPNLNEVEPVEPTIAAPSPAVSPLAKEQGQRASTFPGWLRWCAIVVLLVGLGNLMVKVAGSTRSRRALSARVDGPSRQVSSARSSAVAGVDDLCLRGAYQTELRTPESLKRAESAFQEAIAKDPGFAPAHAGLAVVYLLQREYALLPEPAAYEMANAAANKALGLDPRLPQAHAVVGFVEFFWHWNPKQAEQEFAQAIQLDPEMPLAHHWYGSMLTHEGRYPEALRELNLAQNLQPGSPAILSLRAYALGLSGRRDDAVALLQDAITTEHQGPYRNPATMHQVLASLSLLPPENVSRYLSERMVAAELREDTESVKLLHLAAHDLQVKGENGLWQALLNEDRRLHPNGPTFEMAAYEAELGEKTEAERDLKTLYQAHDPALIGVMVDPLLARLHDDQEFRQLQAAMHLLPNS